MLCLDVADGWPFMSVSEADSHVPQVQLIGEIKGW